MNENVLLLENKQFQVLFSAQLQDLCSMMGCPIANCVYRLHQLGGLSILGTMSKCGGNTHTSALDEWVETYVTL